MSAAYLEGWLLSHIERKNGREEMNRAQKYRASGQTGLFPVLEEGAALLQTLRDLGYVRTTLSSVEVLTAVEISPVVSIAHSPLETWRDVQTIIAMSRRFLDGFNDGKSPLSIPPWERE